MPTPPSTLLIAAPADPATTSVPEIDLVKQYLAALARGDSASVLALLSEDVVLHVPGRSLISGTYRGPHAVLDYTAKLTELASGSYRQLIVIWLLMAPHVHTVTLEHAERHGQGFDFNRSSTYDIKDGKITDMAIHDEDQYAVDAFWS